MERNNYIIIHNVSNFHHITVYQHDPVFEQNKSVIYKKKNLYLTQVIPNNVVNFELFQ